VRKDNLLDPGSRVTEPRHTRITGPLNYLLIGSDARAASPEAGQRSDTMIIVHIPASLDRAYLISVPRDLRVQIPPDPGNNFRGSREKINAAFEFGGSVSGGVQLVSATLTKLTGLRFDGAAVIDFQGFGKVVDMLGGVDLYIDERTESHHIGYDKNGKPLAPWDGPDGDHRNRDSTPQVYEVGWRHMAGWEALDYVRQRKGLPGGDFDRQRHQQQFVRAILRDAIKQGITTDLPKLDKMVRAIGQSLTVDTNGVALTDLAYALRAIRPESMVGIRVPAEPQTIGGISYVIAIESAAGDMYSAIRDDSLDQWAVANATWVNPL
jgi:LCP family protein required for cell wall assembly